MKRNPLVITDFDKPLGIKGAQSIDAAEERGAVGRLGAEKSRELITLEAVKPIVIAEGFGLRVELG